MSLSKLLVVHSLLISLLGISPTAAAPSPSPSPHSKRSTTSTDWHRYVRAPSSNIVYPVSILANLTLGNVTQPSGLLPGATAPTIFTRSSSDDDVPTVVVDFGLNVVGFLSIRFAGASNSTPGFPGVRLAFSETIEYGYLTNVSDFTRSDNGDTITPGSDQIAVQPDPYNWTDPHDCDYPATLQVCSDGLHGFRYVKIYMDALPADAPYTTSYGQVVISSVSLNFTAYLGTPDTFTGWFQSSDEDLNQWWYDAIYTTDMNIATLTENTTDPRNAWTPAFADKLVLIDGAKRDRDPYVGDLAVSGRTLYLTRDTSAPARDVLADLADHQRADGWIPPASINGYTLPLLDYPLWWVASSYDLFMYTGDTAYIQQYYSVMVNALDSFYPSVTNPATQLITKGYGVSGGYGDYAFLGRTGPVTYYNALYVLALNNAASIATFLGGHGDDAARWSERASNVSAAINNLLFDSSAGAFFDGSCGSTPCPTHAQDGNSLSIVSGTVNSSRADSILSYMSANMARPYGNAFYDNDVVSDSQRVYAFISYFELEARFMSGQADSALDQIRRMYGWMANHGPGVTQWEGIGPDGLPYEQGFTSMAHGWSTGIAPAVTNYILGVIPKGPGFSAWSVKPHPGDVAWAQGEVPTPNGPINVYWNNNSQAGTFYMTVNAPAGTSGTISVLANSTVTVYLNSNPVWQNGAATASGASSVDDGFVSVQVAGRQISTVSVGFDGKTPP